MARYTEVEQVTNDLDWFSVDSIGNIAHFASAGSLLPESVALCKEDSELMCRYFRNLATSHTGAVSDPYFLQVAAEAGNNIEACDFSGFMDMCKRGLFSFDSSRGLGGNGCSYLRMFIPDVPLLFTALPDEIKMIISRTAFSLAFSEVSKVDGNGAT